MDLNTDGGYDRGVYTAFLLQNMFQLTGVLGSISLEHQYLVVVYAVVRDIRTVCVGVGVIRRTALLVFIKVRFFVRYGAPILESSEIGCYPSKAKHPSTSLTKNPTYFGVHTGVYKYI